MNAAAPPTVSARPTVSVVMANFNGAAYLTDAIRSVQKQSLRELEIIVSDDASTDNSIELITGLMAQDRRIRLVRGKRNGGPAAARNRALAEVTGEWISVMDSDDLMHPERLATLVTSAVHDGADIVADDLLIFHSHHFHPPTTLLNGRWARAPFWVELKDYIRLNGFYGRGPALGYLKPLFRASVLADASARYDETLRIAEDYNLVLHLLISGASFRIYPLLLYFYRRHSTSSSFRLNADVLAAIKAADVRLLNGSFEVDRSVTSAIHGRIRTIEIASAYDKILLSLKEGKWGAAIRVALASPQALPLLRMPIVARLHRLFARSANAKGHSDRRQVCILSRQRVVGRTNGSSVYLLDLADAIAKRGFDLHFIAPSPTTLGRWPYLTLSKDLSVFKTVRIRGTWRWGYRLFSLDPRRFGWGALAVLDRALLRLGFRAQFIFKRAPYSIAQPLTRDDQLFIARHAPAVGDFLIADYCFLTDAFPYALRQNSGTAVVMHDRFSSRPSQFNSLANSSAEVLSAITEENECKLLSQARTIVAIQWEEAELIRRHLPSHDVIVAPMAAHPVGAPQPGKGDLILFVASAAAPNVDGLKWFLDRCWPRIREKQPNARFFVAGTLSHVMGPAPDGVRFLGFVSDLEPLYREAGVIVSPLRIGSGLKVKLIEALSRGKAVVATSKTLQGVETYLSDAVLTEDQPERFSDSVLMLLNDEKARLDLASHGLDRIRASFTPDACYGAFVKEMENNTVSLMERSSSEPWSSR
jgi:glycosyltransferase involved in cell wall biosynthesis